MPNTPVRAAAEGMPAISRRHALAVTGSGLAATLAGLAASTVKASAAASINPEPEYPWVKARRLCRELSSTLADCDGGEWKAEVYAPGNPHPVMFVNAEWERERRTADAELIRLGAELDRARATYEELDAERTRLYKVCEPLLVLDADGGMQGDKQDAFFAAADATGYSKASDASTAGWDRIDALSKQIQSLPAVTLAGFAAKAAAIEWELLYAFPELEDAADIALRQFVSAMRKAGGVS